MIGESARDMNLHRRSYIFRYGSAILLTLLATGLRAAIDPYLGHQVPFVTYFFAVVVAAWLGGPGPTLLTVVLSGITASHYFIPLTMNVFPRDPAGWTGLMLFLTFGIATAAISRWIGIRNSVMQNERESFAFTLSSITDGVISTDRSNRVVYLNSAAEALTGWRLGEAQNQSLSKVFRLTDVPQQVALAESGTIETETRDVKTFAADDSQATGTGRTGTLLVRDAAPRMIEYSVSPIHGRDGVVDGQVLTFRDISERRRAAETESEYRRLLELRLNVTTALAADESLLVGLQHVAASFIEHLDVVVTRVWTLDERTATLQLQATAGLLTDLGGSDSRIAVGQSRIGRIAETGKPDITSDVLSDATTIDADLAERESLTVFAGYPLTFGGRVFGVLAMFARQPLPVTALKDLETVCDGIAQWIDRKRQQQRLTQSEKLHRVLGELTSDYGMVCQLSPAGDLTIDLVTEGFTKVTGYTLQTLEADGGWPSLLEPQEMAKVQASIEQWLNDIDHSGTLRVRTKSGAMKTIEYFGRAERGSDHGNVQIYVAVQDITENREAELEHQRQRRWLSGTLSSIGDAVIATDNAGCVTFLNHVAQRLTGWSQQESAGKPLSEVFRIINESTRLPVANPVEKVLRDGVTVGLANHTILLSRSGDEFPVDDSAAPIRDESGTIIGVVLVFRDVTKQKESERQVRDSERRYRLIGDAANDTIWDWDLTTNLVQWNEGVSSCFGYAKDQVDAEASWWTDRIHPNDFAFVTDGIHAAIDDGSTQWNCEYRFRRADGSYAYVFDRGRIVHDSQGQAIRMVGSMLDLTQRRMAEQQLQEREAQYRSIFESTSDALLIFSEQGYLIEVNPAACRMHGYSRDEMLGMHGTQLVHRDDHDKFADFVAKVKSGEMFQVDGTHLKKDGSLVSIKVTGSAFAYAGQSALLAVVRDVSEERKAIEALRDNEELLRFTLDATEIGQWDLDLQTNAATRTLRHDQIFGYPTLLTDWSYEIFLEKHVHPDDRQRVDLLFRNAIENHDDWEYECRMIRADGALRWIWVMGSAYLFNEDKPQRMAGLVMDITDRVNAEAALRENDQRFRTLVEQVKDYAIFMTDASGRPTSWNAGVQRVIGFAEHEFIGEDLAQRIFMPEDIAAGVPERELSEAVASGTSAHERWMQRGDGTPFYALGVTTALIDDSGQPLGFMNVMRDQTERKQMEDELRRIAADLSDADRRKDEFLAMLAHELRNPLAPIRSGLELLAMDLTAQADNNDIVRLMQDQVEHLVRLVDDLLDVSRIMRGKVELRRQKIALSTLIKRSVAAVTPMIDSHNHRLIVRDTEPSIWIDADPVRIVQVIENLLNNAAKYMNPGGEIELIVQRRDDRAVVQVRDRGIGIEPELLPNVFDLFTQSTRSLDRSQGGLGIGLTLVQRLVELHAGTVTADSEGLDCGSTFTFSLPTAEAVEVKPTAQPMHSDHARRIVVVDDNRGAVFLLSRLLGKLGNHQISSAHDGPSALETIRQANPEIVLLDIGLPGMDGYQVAQTLRKDPGFDDVLLVALTGYGQEEDRRRSRDAGFDEHLVKPPSVDQMRTVLSHTKLKGN